MIDSETVRVRFPPSPTGHWHLGGARTALFNWLFARQKGGAFVLRIEDTDRERSSEEYEIEIVESLKWLGLDWDEGPEWTRKNGKWHATTRGEFGPYRQSERTDIYRKYLEKLLGDGKAYFCYCTSDELEAQRNAMQGAGLAPKYSGRCRNVAHPPDGKRPTVIRFKTPETIVEFKDVIRGTVKFDASLFGDFVIAKDPESPLYNFAVVVDDELMRITHVIRGEDHIPNTPKQILLARALGFELPTYAHLPLILAPDRKKLSKRYMETSLLDYRKEGYLPEGIINFLSLLGWHPKDEREILSKEDLIKEFDLRRTQKAGAVFLEEKMGWLNAQHLRRMSADEIALRLAPHLEERGITADKNFLLRVVEAERERSKTLSDFLSLGGFFFELPPYDAGLLVWKDQAPRDTKAVLDETAALLRWLSPESFTEETLRGALTPLIQRHGRGGVLWPVRAAVSGLAASPDPLLIAAILGKEETIRRIEIASKKLG